MKHKLVILTVMLAVALAGFSLIVSLQSHRLEVLNSSITKNEMQKKLEAARASSKPESLAVTRFLKIVSKSRMLLPSDLEIIRKNLLEAFGSEIRFLISDAEMKSFISNGFSEKDEEHLESIIKIYSDSHSGVKNIISEEINKKLAALFGEQFILAHVPNYLTTYYGNFGEDRGIVIFGFIMNRDMLKNSSSRASRPVKDPGFEGNRHSSVIAFIPERIFSNPDWFEKNMDLILNDGSLSFKVGNALQIADLINQNSANEDKKFAKEIPGQNKRGTWEGKKSLFFYYDTGLKRDQQAIYLLGERSLPETGSFSHNLLRFSIALLFILLLLTLINNSNNQEFLKLNLMQHFLLLTLLSVSIPLLALGFQSFSQIRSRALNFDEEIFKNLEHKLGLIDKEYNIETGDMLTAINAFQIFCDELPEYSREIIDKTVQNLFKYRVTQVYSSGRTGTVDVYDLRSESQTNNEVSREGTRFLTVLVKFIQHSLKMGDSSQEMAVKDGMIIETAAEALGTENLYLLALHYNKLMTFKMLHGAVWTLTLLQKDPAGTMKRFFMYIIHRSALQHLLIDRWQQRFVDGLPEYAFANQNFSYLGKIAPIWAEQNPYVFEMLRDINLNGGLIKTKFQYEGKTIYCLGRRIKNFDWACMAFEAKKAAAATGFETGILIFLIILYIISATGIVAIYFNSIFIQPVVSLGKHVNSMAEGNYDLKIQTDNNDEIGQMCQSFNHMAQSLKEKEFLSRFLSDIARDAISGKVSNRATRIHATVLFSDIRDFTTITEQNDPEVIVDMLNDYMTVMEEAIESEAGSIEKFIGDAIMAVFLPAHGLSHPAVRAARAAEKMMTGLKGFNKDRVLAGKFEIAAGAGIATGELLMGIMGNEKGRRDYTVTGITVKAAATMEKHTRFAAAKKIVLCPSSAELVSSSGLKTRKLKTVEAFELI